MDTTEAERLVAAQVNVTRSIVTIAKSYVRTNHMSSVEQTVRDFLAFADAEMPKEVLLHPTVDPAPELSRVARSITYRLAAMEAAWELVLAGDLIPASTNLLGGTITTGYTTILERGSGARGGLSWHQFDLRIPDHLSRPPSRNAPAEPLTDGDLFLRTLEIPDLHEDIQLALREGVQCLRFELFDAAIAMLGKAVEGAWIELGVSLARMLDTFRSGRGIRMEQDMRSADVGIARKIRKVLDTFTEDPGLYEAAGRPAGVRANMLRDVGVWSATVRESRNAIHHGVDPGMPNSFAKAAALYIGAVSNLRTLYVLRAAVLRELNGNSGSG